MPLKSTHQGPEDTLDERFYDLSDEELILFKQQTGIRDDNELKAHLLQVQAEAYKSNPYPCLHMAKIKISGMFPYQYQYLLNLGQQRKNSVFLDIGSCLGTDARKVVADGYPLENVVTFDLCQEFQDLGHKLFRTTPETYPIAFVPGDAFDPRHLKVVPPFTTANAPTGPMPDLRSLTSLNPLHGRVSAIQASCLFHLFGEEKQLHLARALAGLLSPEPGSMIFGVHLGHAKKGSRPTFKGDYLFCHSPDSWTQLWDCLVFEKGAVKVLNVLDVDGDETVAASLYWTVMRV